MASEEEDVYQYAGAYLDKNITYVFTIAPDRIQECSIKLVRALGATMSTDNPRVDVTVSQNSFDGGSILCGEEYHLTIDTSDDKPVKYSWYRENVLLEETGATLTINGDELYAFGGPEREYDYYCIVEYPDGSQNATLHAWVTYGRKHANYDWNSYYEVVWAYFNDLPGFTVSDAYKDHDEDVTVSVTREKYDFEAKKFVVDKVLHSEDGILDYGKIGFYRIAYHWSYADPNNPDEENKTVEGTQYLNFTNDVNVSDPTIFYYGMSLYLDYADEVYDFDPYGEGGSYRRIFNCLDVPYGSDYTFTMPALTEGVRYAYSFDCKTTWNPANTITVKDITEERTIECYAVGEDASVYMVNLTLRPIKQPQDVKLSATSTKVNVGATSTVNVTGAKENPTITFSSSNDAIAKVNATTGVVTAVSPGKVTITVNLAETDSYAEGSWTIEIQVTLATPTVTLANNVNEVKVSWNKIAGATGYYVYRKLAGGSYSKIATITSASTLSYADTTTTGGKTYYYYVKAYKGSSTSGYAEKSILRLTTTTPTLANDVSGVKVSWTKVAGATGYYIYRKLDGGSYSKIATITNASTVTYTDKSAASGKIYYYSVKAYNGSTTSSYNAKSIVRLSAPTTTLSNASAGTSVTWTKVTGATGYYVYRKLDGGSYSKIATITSGKTTSYTDKSAAAGKTYYYYVKAYNGSTGSGYTAVKMIRLANTSVTLANASSGISVAWTKVAGATGYYVYRKVSGGSYSKIATIKSASTLKYTDTSAANGKTYEYIVKAYNGSVVSSYSAKTMVRLTTPTLSSLKNPSAGKLTITWKKASSITGYVIKYSDGSTTKTVTVSSTTAVSKTISSLKKGKTYKVYIRSYKTVSGTKYYSAWSAAKSLKLTK